LGRNEYLSAWRKEIAVNLTLLFLFTLLTTYSARTFYSKRIQAVLHKEEARSRAILEKSPVPLVLIDEKGIISYLNSAFLKQIGYTLDEIPTLTDWRIRAYPDPQYRQMIIDNMGDKIEEFRERVKHFSTLEANVTCRDGSVRNFILNVEFLPHDHSESVLLSLFDITERKQTEKQLENRYNFERLLTNISTHFISLPADCIDDALIAAQKGICEYLGVDICTLWQFSPDRPDNLMMTHIYVPPGVPFEAPETIDAKGSFPWCLEMMMKKEVIVLPRVTDAPAAAARDLES